MLLPVRAGTAAGAKAIVGGVNRNWPLEEAGKDDEDDGALPTDARAAAARFCW